MCPPTQEELDALPHVFFTSDEPWDPTVLDCEHDELEEFHDALCLEDPDVIERRENRDPRIDDHGFLCSRSDCEVMFTAQDEFIQSTPRCVDWDEHETHHDASSSGVVHIDELGEEHVEPPAVTRQARVIARLANQISAFPNRLQ